jgi:integration host factor subunit beta
MIRSELIARVGQQNPHLTTEESEAVVRTILNRVSDALANGDRVEIRGFGTSSTMGLPGRQARNPRTGMATTVPVRTHVHFRPGKAMQARLNLENT